MGVVMAESSRSDAAMILWAGGTATDAQGGFVVPVDRSVRRLTFSITFDGTGGSAEIAKPDGAVVQAGAGDTILNCGRILSVDAPEAGDWRVTPVPSSRFWMTVHARSDRDLLTAEFVRRAGRPGHEGLFRINGSPIAGRPGILRIALSDPEERPPVFELLSAQGRSIQRVPLDRVADDEFVGEMALPSVPFRVGVSGTDADGGRYQRMDRADVPRRDRWRSCRLSWTRSGPAPMRRSGSSSGATADAGRYRVTATVGAEVLTRVEPPAVDLATDSEQRVTVWLPARTIAAAGTSLELLVMASSEDPDQSSTNSAFLRLARRQALTVSTHATHRRSHS